MAEENSNLPSEKEVKITQHMAEEKEHVEKMLADIAISPTPEQARDISADKPSRTMAREAQQKSHLKYSPLPSASHIRVLKLLPGQIDDPIRCSLEFADLDSGDPTYWAVSYAWGNLNDQRSIECDGCTINVTKSLYQALERFRAPEEEYTLWVDALCIDQQNFVEKTAQVRLMQMIYQKASHVLVFLGHENIENLEDDLKTICQYVAQHYPRGWRGSNPRYYFEDCWVEEFGPETNMLDPIAGDIAPLNRICSAPWFSRGWVIQEAALPVQAMLFWGESQIEFHWIGLAAYEVSRVISPNLLPNAIRHCSFMQMLHESQHGSLDLFSFFVLLVTTHDVLYSDRRDRVYGLLGIKTTESDPGNGRPFINPDYSLSTLDCYRVATEKLLIDLKDLRALRAIHHGLEIKEDWPSWVPVWDYHRTGTLLRMPPDPDPEPELPSQVKTSKVIVENHECIRIAGLTIDTVDHQIMEQKNLAGLKNHKQRLRHIQSLLRQLEQSYSVKILASTFGDSNIQPPSEQRSSSFLEKYHAFVQWNPAWDENATEAFKSAFVNDLESENKKSVSFYQAYLRRWHARYLFKSKKGMLVLGPEAMREGDVVVYFFGSMAPFVLRPVEKLWRFVGECYVHELIEDFVLEEWTSNEKTIEFCIY